METAKFCGLSWTIPSVFFGNESRGPYQRLELARVVHSGTVGERIAILERLAGEKKQEMFPAVVHHKIFVYPIEQGVVQHLHDNANAV